MVQEANHVIIGAGVLGCSVAYGESPARKRPFSNGLQRRTFPILMNRYGDALTGM
jgi:hypothetical protein